MDMNFAEATDLSQVLARPGCDFQSLMAAIEQSKIEVADLSAAALCGVLKGVITGEDGEVLVWIASHVHNKKRLKSTLMGLSAFLTGIGATLSIAAPSMTAVVDLIA